MVLLWEDFTAVGGPARVEVSPGDYVSWSERNRSFTGVAGFGLDKYNLTGAGDPDKLTGVSSCVDATSTIRIKFGPANAPGLWLTVVGVVGDVREMALETRAEPEMYGPSNQGQGIPPFLVGAFALLAFAMAAIGLYGVLACGVAQRLPEIGVRVALWAARTTVVVETLRGAMTLAAVGIGLGLIPAARGASVDPVRVLRSE